MKISLFLSPLLLLCCFYCAQGQNIFAQPNGIDYDGDGSCSNPAAPCTLNAAGEDAADGGGNSNTIYALLSDRASSVVFGENFIVSDNLALDTYAADTIVVDTIEVDGNVVIDGNAILTIAANVVLRLNEGSSLILGSGAKIDGDGEILLSNNLIFLGDPDNTVSEGPRTATIENLAIDPVEGLVEVVDQGPDSDVDKSNLFITNRLKVLNGVFDMDDNNLWMVGPTNEGGVAIEADASIQGAGTFYLSVDPAALGGPPNTRADAYPVRGEGSLNMAFDKNTDAGVIIELNEIGSGGRSFNRAGALYVTNATSVNGTFLAESASRTEFDQLNQITSNLEIRGPGGEVFPSNGTCGDGNESGVYFFSPVSVEGDVILVDTDDPALSCGVQGLSFMADNLDQSAISTVEGDLSAKEKTGLTLSSLDEVAHNMALQGDVFLDESPTFQLDNIGTDCDCQNRVLFTGNNNQLLKYSNDLLIEAVEVVKNSSDGQVEIDPESGMLQIYTWLNLVRGQFTTNGLLDANGATENAEGNCVTIRYDDVGLGKLDKGVGQSAYYNDATVFTPGKIKYTGTQNILSGDEIPGPVSDLALHELEVSLASEELAVSLGKNLNISGLLKLSSGDLQLNGQEINLGNTGELAESPGNTVGGEQGTIKGEGDLNAPSNENIGNLGAVISSGQNLGLTTVIRGHAAQA
ncbi:MAG: hypothetical protein ACR2MX_09605, partial [Cyclobacteriaceae bacterium]